MKIRELLDKPDKWTQGSYAKTKDGGIVHPSSSHACKWCLAGAARKCYIQGSKEFYDIIDKIEYAIINKYNTTFINVPAFNDSVTITYKDIKALVDELDV